MRWACPTLSAFETVGKWQRLVVIKGASQTKHALTRPWMPPSPSPKGTSSGSRTSQSDRKTGAHCRFVFRCSPYELSLSDWSPHVPIISEILSRFRGLSLARNIRCIALVRSCVRSLRMMQDEGLERCFFPSIKGFPLQHINGRFW